MVLRRLIPLTIALLAACKDTIPEAPSDLAINPNSGQQSSQTPVTITGRRLSSGLKIDFGNPSNSAVLHNIGLSLINADNRTDLIDVRLDAKDTLMATVPAGLDVGRYDLELIDAFGRKVTAPSAFEIRAATCDELNNAPGGTDCTACDQNPNCKCDEDQVCKPRCGDGEIVEPDEECDDGNEDAGDGCTDTCTVELGWTCTSTPSACGTTCGDARRAAIEACDDGNTDNGDGCAAGCTIEAGYACSGDLGGRSTCSANCGDGIVDGSEQCDDGNDFAGDGCSEACAVEAGFTCSGVPSGCTPICGDGLVRGGEPCDDQNSLSGDGCSSDCIREEGFDCTDTAPTMCTPVCGDGLVRGDEPCDDRKRILLHRRTFGLRAGLWRRHRRRPE